MLDILNQTISGNLFAFLLVFMRVGAAVFLIPGLSDTTVSANVRLLFALVVSFLLTPVLQDRLPPEPAQVDQLFALLFGEIVIGSLFGTVMRLILSALEVTGQIISLNIGLANGFLFNPMFNSQASLPSALLATAGLTLIFVTNLHHEIFKAIADTYAVFPPGQALHYDDMAYLIARQTMWSFDIGVRLAAPFIITTLLFFLGMGVITRIMPQMQVFFVALPLQQLGGVLLLMFGIGAILMMWIGFADQQIALFPAPAP